MKNLIFPLFMNSLMYGKCKVKILPLPDGNVILNVARRNKESNLTPVVFDGRKSGN